MGRVRDLDIVNLDMEDISMSTGPLCPCPPSPYPPRPSYTMFMSTVSVSTMSMSMVCMSAMSKLWVFFCVFLLFFLGVGGGKDVGEEEEDEMGEVVWLQGGGKRWN